MEVGGMHKRTCLATLQLNEYPVFDRSEYVKSTSQSECSKFWQYRLCAVVQSVLHDCVHEQSLCPENDDAVHVNVSHPPVVDDELDTFTDDDDDDDDDHSKLDFEEEDDDDDDEKGEKKEEEEEVEGETEGEVVGAEVGRREE